MNYIARFSGACTSAYAKWCCEVQEQYLPILCITFIAANKNIERDNSIRNQLLSSLKTLQLRLEPIMATNCGHDFVCGRNFFFFCFGCYRSRVIVRPYDRGQVSGQPAVPVLVRLETSDSMDRELPRLPRRSVRPCSRSARPWK